MAKEYDFMAAGHPNIYTGDSREFKIYFSEPEAGVNENTGILLLIAGYGGHAESNVYKKMRREFADQYNLVCVQCDYFGYEFMQLEFLEETTNSFNDMSVMQALDNLTALLMVVAILKDNNLTFNTKKIIAYGHSHGAYLCHLCNVYAPELFSFLIDNSAYLYPAYLLDTHARYLNVNNKEGKAEDIEFHYIVKRKSLKMKRELIDLNMLYKNFENKCPIVTFQWVNDHIVDATEKGIFCESIKKCSLVRVDVPDGVIIKSDRHGDADFIKLFEFMMSQRKFDVGHSLSLPDVKIGKFSIDYGRDLPVFKK
ncbi:DUF2920 family protein [Paenibacillus psychroresistens]|uniref:DUF2920 family protein n=1 Tax=Paenibacillus psychroresistens TaxID=1778678 RepID=A0A6B8RCK8_9BACL|nr:DUF2920 family protein [Paenibacillus psychroresistens]QGQ93930.1 DUF2920 family protein [Paenibacillus psychroresistens]